MHAWAVTSGGTATVLFDGACPFCRRQTARLQRWVPDVSLSYRSFRAPGALDAFPHLSPEDCDREMKLVEESGRTSGGMESVVRILSRRMLLRPAMLYYLPGLRQVLDAIYRWIAARRMRLSGGVCEDTTCSLPDSNG